jgi:cofilin
VTIFNDLKLKHNMKYIVYKMNDAMTEIQVHKTGGKDANYAEFLAELPEAECRYGVFDVEYEDPKTSSKRNKITFFAWCPDVAKVKPKMIYASSKDELKKRLVGIACEIQGSDTGDVEYDEVVKNIIRLSK